MPKKTIKKIKSFKCPNCGKMQTSVVEWRTVSVGFEHNLTTRDSEKFDSVSGEFESFSCISCGEDLPTKMHEEIEKMLGW